MEESVNYAEYTVEKKAEGAHGRKGLTLILIYVIFCLGGLVTFVGILKLWPVGAIIPLLTYILWGLTWRYAQLEHHYEVANAKFRISNIYGRKRKETIFENLVSEFELIAPMTDEYKEKFENADEILDYRGSKKSSDSYFARLTKDGKTTVIYFEAINKMLKVMRFYNSKGTVVTEMRY